MAQERHQESLCQPQKSSCNDDRTQYNAHEYSDLRVQLEILDPDEQHQWGMQH